MDNQQKEYYQLMFKKNRLLPFIIEDKEKGDSRLACIFTFYIGKDNKNKYVRDDMWSVIEDEPDGNVCWIDHLITDKDPTNPRFSHVVWHKFKEYIQRKYPNVKEMKWSRYNFITHNTAEVKYELHS